MITEMATMIDEEVTSEVDRNLDEIKTDLNSQTLNSISSTIAEQVLPSIKNTLGGRGRGNNALVDHQSGEQHSSAKAKTAR